MFVSSQSEDDEGLKMKIKWLPVPVSARRVTILKSGLNAN